MKVEVLALRKNADRDRALNFLAKEGSYKFEAALYGVPLSCNGDVDTLVIDSLESIACGHLDELRQTVNHIEAHRYARLIFIANLDKHGALSHSARRRIEAMERDVGIEKVLGPTKVHYEKVEFSPYIFVETGFQRASQPIFVLAMLESSRRILVERECCEDLEYVADVAAAHYEVHQGQLDLWGWIKRYQYHDGRGRVYVGQPEGRFIEVAGSAARLCQDRARLSMGIHLSDSYGLRCPAIK